MIKYPESFYPAYCGLDAILVLPWLQTHNGHCAARDGGRFLQQSPARPRRGADSETGTPFSQVALELVTTFVLTL